MSWPSRAACVLGQQRPRFDVVLATAAMDEASKNAWCRTNGVYPQELASCRENAMSALSSAEAPAHKRAVNKAELGNWNASCDAKIKRLPRLRPLLMMSKKNRSDLEQGFGRGQMIGLEDRQCIAQDIGTAYKGEARLYMACKLVGTLNRWVAVRH